MLVPARSSAAHAGFDIFGKTEAANQLPRSSLAQVIRPFGARRIKRREASHGASRNVMSNTEHSGPRMRPGYESAIDDIAERGAAALRDAKAGVDDVAADARARANEVLDGARDVRDTVADAILESVRTRPYTTLVIAGLAGFIFGAMRRR
jgi:ElaB/YqjD/DUF883 family membrane-anchored ribosome-binding protein